MKKKTTILKRQRQEVRRRKYNKIQKAKLKSTVKKAKKAILAQDVGSTELFKKAEKCLDKSAAKKIIHKNTAARKKSRLAKFRNKFGIKTSGK